MGHKAMKRGLAATASLSLAVLALAGCGGSGGGVSAPSTPSSQTVQQTNLVQDTSGAAFTDAKLINAWGLGLSASGNLWVADNGTGDSTAYGVDGHPQATVVAVAPSGAGGGSKPSGLVINSTSDFLGDTVIFATESGTISGWQSGGASTLRADNSATGAVYKGAAIAVDGTDNLLYATNFHAGTIDVFNKAYQPVAYGSLSKTGAHAAASPFTDPNLPAGFAPFGIRNINGNLYVTYAKQNAQKTADVAGAGNGAIDVYSPAGTLLMHLVSGGALNSPWGLALAPAGFGNSGASLLVGNFGDGHINAYDPTSGSSLGALATSGGTLAIDGLWGLTFGTGATANTLFFTSGPSHETHGLLGSLTVVGAASKKS